MRFQLKRCRRGRIDLFMERARPAGLLFAISALSLVALCGAPAFASDARTAKVEATSEIRFTGSSPLHDWEGKAPPVHSTLSESTIPGQWNTDLVIPVAGLDSDEPSRDARMREMFRADRWPDIHVEIRDIDPAATSRSGELVASLTIGDVTRDVTTRITNWKEDGDRASFDAGAVVSLKAFSLDAPTVLGLIRVADEVKVNAHVTIEKIAATPAAQESTGALSTGTPR